MGLGEALGTESLILRGFVVCFEERAGLFQSMQNIIIIVIIIVLGSSKP